jgi:hypothetical protein
MYQPYPSSGQPKRPPAPAPVLTAVKLMYAGAPVSAVSLITSLAYLAYLVGSKDAGLVRVPPARPRPPGRPPRPL